MYNPFMPSQPAPQPPYSMYNTRMEIIKVNGEGGARAFQMPPNSQALLLDETAPLVWLKTTDGASYPSLTPYTITPYQPEPPIDVHTLDERIKKLEEIINVKSNAATVEQKSDGKRPANGQQS